MADRTPRSAVRLPPGHTILAGLRAAVTFHAALAEASPCALTIDRARLDVATNLPCRAVSRRASTTSVERLLGYRIRARHEAAAAFRRALAEASPMATTTNGERRSSLMLWRSGDLRFIQLRF